MIVKNRSCRSTVNQLNATPSVKCDFNSKMKLTLLLATTTAIVGAQSTFTKGVTLAPKQASKNTPSDVAGLFVDGLLKLNDIAFGNYSWSRKAALHSKVLEDGPKVWPP